jgi:hypothetical protein
MGNRCQVLRGRSSHSLASTGTQLRVARRPLLYLLLLHLHQPLLQRFDHARDGSTTRVTPASTSSTSTTHASLRRPARDLGILALNHLVSLPNGSFCAAIRLLHAPSAFCAKRWRCP